MSFSWMHHWAFVAILIVAPLASYAVTMHPNDQQVLLEIMGCVILTLDCARVTGRQAERRWSLIAALGNQNFSIFYVSHDIRLRFNNKIFAIQSAVIYPVFSLEKSRCNFADDTPYGPAVFSLSCLHRNATELPASWKASNISNACDWVDAKSIIRCNSSGRIIRIEIELVNLNMTIPPALARLPALESLQFERCGMYGTIPSWLFTPKLKYLNLPWNVLNGTIPNAILTSTNLVSLDVSLNVLEGTIPSGLANFKFLTTFGIYNNRFECPFPVELYYKLNDPAHNTSFCTMNGNNWDSEMDGTICGNASLVPQGPVRCPVHPFTTRVNLRDKTPDFVFSNSKITVEIHGTQMALMARHPNGTTLRAAYGLYRIFSLHFYNETVAPVDLKPPSVRLFEVQPIAKFTNLTQVSPDLYELSAYLPGQRVETLTAILNLNVPNSPASFKFSLKIASSKSFFWDRTRPAALALTSAYEVVGHLFNPDSRLQCDISLYQDMLVGESSCQSDRFKSSFFMEYYPMKLSWKYDDPENSFSFDVPLVYKMDNVDTNFYWLRSTLYIKGYGPYIGLLAGFPWVPPPIEQQALSFQDEPLFRGNGKEILWDPTLNLVSLLSDATGEPASAPVTESVSLAVVIAVPVAIVVVAGVVGAFLLIPSIRRKIFSFDNARHQTKKRLHQRNLASQQDQESRPTTMATVTESEPKRGTWVSSRPTTQN